MSTVLLDAAGRRRSPATMPGFPSGPPPRNKGRRYPADPPKVGQIVAVIRQAGMAWEQLQQWLDVRVELPVGPLFCVLTGATRGRACERLAAYN